MNLVTGIEAAGRRSNDKSKPYYEHFGDTTIDRFEAKDTLSYPKPLLLILLIIISSSVIIT